MSDSAVAFSAGPQHSAVKAATVGNTVGTTGVRPARYPPRTGTRQILEVGLGIDTGQPGFSGDRNRVHRVPGQHMDPFTVVKRA